jgi:hypothetical protein
MPRRLVRPRHLGECHVHVRRVGDGRSSPTRLCGRILNRPRRVRSTSTPGVPVTGLVALQCCRGRSCRRGCGGRSPVDRELRHIRLSRHRSTGTLFRFGIVVGAVAMLGLSVLLAGARRTAGRGRDARHELKRSPRETAFLNQDRDQRLEHQPVSTPGRLRRGRVVVRLSAGADSLRRYRCTAK